MLDFDQRYSEQTLRKRCNVIEVHTWSDPLIGNACGQPDELCNLLELEIKEKKSKRPILVSLIGPLKYTNPNHTVHQWLQTRTKKSKSYSPRPVCSVHIRVPEEWCCNVWKEMNCVHHYADTIYQICNVDPRFHDTVTVFTEESFTTESENVLKSVCPKVNIHRGTNSTIVSDLQQMSSSDLLVVSASHFSALAGYMLSSSALLIVANESENTYFEHHKKLGCNITGPGQPDFVQMVQRVIMSIA